MNTVPVEHRRRRMYLGWRERVTILPQLLFLNLSRSGASLTIHFWIASWNTRTGWYLHGPFGFYLRERRIIPRTRSTRTHRRSRGRRP